MGRKILIIEDNDDDLMIMKRYLEEAGYDEIFNAQDAGTGLKMAVEEKPDLAILDTLLPGSNGFEICSKIRETCGQGAPKIIIITGSIDAVDAVKARRVGADDYCVKTSDCAPLMEAVKKIFI
jgi:DNA-binding response OmpR family regulator